MSFNDKYLCVDCGRIGIPETGVSSTDEYKNGFYVCCPECGFTMAGRGKKTVLQALSVIAAWNGRVSQAAGNKADPVENSEMIRLREAMERAYGLLWRDTQTNDISSHARAILLEQMDRDGQRRGIEYATKTFGPVTDHEALRDFP